MPKPQNLPDAFLIDMDGTLIDSEPYWMEIEQDLAHQWGATWTQEQAEALVGNSMDHSCEIFRSIGVDMSNEDLLDYFMTHMVQKMHEKLPFRPGVERFLQEARELNIPCCLVTMSHRPMADALLEELPEDTFVASVTGDMVRKGKPSPEPYLMAVELLKEAGHDIDISRCIAIEDSVPGVKSALSAGAVTVAVPMIHDLEGFDGLVVWDGLEGKNMKDFQGVLAHAQ